MAVAAVFQPVLRSEVDYYVPQFEVRLANRKLPTDAVRDVLQVTYKDSLMEIDRAELTVNNWDAEKLRFKYSDESLFVPGKQFELYLGYYGRQPLRRVLTGEITSMRPAFPAGGPPTLAIEALDVLHRFRRKQESHTYLKKTDSKIAREVATRLKIKDVRTDSKAEAKEEAYPYIIQDNQHDIVFLLERARRIGYDLFIDELNGKTVLHFGPSQNVQRITTELIYGRTLTEFSTNLSTAQQVSKVTVLGWDNVRKKEIRYTALRSSLETKGVGAKGKQDEIDASYRDREEIIADKPVNSLKEAKTLAAETLQNIAKEMLTGTGSTVGIPDLRAGSILKLGGLGARFSGRYFVTSTTHTLGDGGYTTSFECRREEVE
jgi:phage protein D